MWAREKFMPGALYSFTFPPARTWEIKVNGEVVKTKVDKGFAVIDRSWKSSDQVQLDLPMPVQVSTCIDKVEAYRGRVAITRGPLVYCAEEVDNNGPVHRLAIPEVPNADQIEVHEIPDGVLNGVRLISLPGVQRIDGKEEPVSINLVPYYTWANRGNKSMAVWIPQGPVTLADPLKWIPATGAKPPRSKYGADTEVIFENRSGQHVKVVWVSYRGELKLYGELAPGETRHQGTYAGSAWLITGKNDKPLGHFIAGPRAARAVIPE